MKKESYNEYLVIRQNAQEIITNSESSLEKCIFTLSCGLLGITASIYPFLKDRGTVVLCYLKIGWILAGVSLIGNIVSIFIAKLQAREMIEYIDKQIDLGNDYDEKNMRAQLLKRNKQIDLCNKISVVCLIGGIIFTLLFISK